MITAVTLQKCKDKLVLTRQDILESLSQQDTTNDAGNRGDSADLVKYQENQNLSMQRKEALYYKLKQVDAALHRIDSEGYGICEETEEWIEEKRLLAIPWTTLSIIGAEIREEESRVYQN